MKKSYTIYCPCKVAELGYSAIIFKTVEFAYLFKIDVILANTSGHKPIFDVRCKHCGETIKVKEFERCAA